MEVKTFKCKSCGYCFLKDRMESNTEGICKECDDYFQSEKDAIRLGE